MPQRRRKRNGFSQKSPPFLTYLKNILRKYPDGGQILKELIQNADDAGASEVIFVHDERDYGKETVWSDDLLNFQGPALLAYNNATFSHDDWEGIQRTGNSLKLKDPNTVGRFGLGFNSVYHITDLPAVYSGGSIGMLDPQRTAFDDGGFMWNLEDEEDRNEVQSLTDQFLPFFDVLSVIDCGNCSTSSEIGYFQGTLFRFPLRSKPSEISDNLYTTERVKELFECFSKDASISLLFLRNVTQVSLKIIGRDGTVQHLLTASVITQDNETHETISNASSKLFTSIDVKVTSLHRSGAADEVCKWLVVTSKTKEGSFQDLDELANKLGNTPTVGLAYALVNEDRNSYGGRLSCFLPLPDREENRTGLPVIINATFDLTDDRRSIKWVEVDQQHDEAAQWNQLLVEKILPLVYCQAVQAAVSLVRCGDGPENLAYGIWPDPSQTQHKQKWHWLTENVSQRLLNSNVLCRAADNTQWLKATEAIFMKTDVQNYDLHHALQELLLYVGEPLVRVPEHVLSALQLASGTLMLQNMVSPAYTRRILRQGSWVDLHHKEKLLILEYVVGDGQYRDLLGLQLLPLSDGTFISFQDTQSDAMAFIDSPRYPRVLLPGLADKFLPSDLKPGLFQHLRKIGENRLFKNVLCLDKEVIRKYLPKALPESWISGPEQVTWHLGDSHHPPREWLHVIWNFLQQDVDVLSQFEGYPLVPLIPMQNSAQQLKLTRLPQKSSLLFQTKDGHSLAENSVRMMETVGCTVIQKWDSTVFHKTLSNYILTPTSNNILKAFSNLGVDIVLRKLSVMSTEQKKMLSDLLSQATCFSTEECKILSLLPIFCKTKSLQSSGSELVAVGNARAVEFVTVPQIPQDLVLPVMLLVCRDEQDRRLLLHMNVPFLSAPDVALLSTLAIKNGQYALHQHNAEEIMLWVLRNGDVLFSQNKELRKICKSLHFIPCNGELVRPCSLFDPQITTFQELFECWRFPPRNFQEPLILKSLRSLGLMDSIRDITKEDVLHIAEDVSKNHNIRELHIIEKKAKALIRVCNDTQVLSSFDDRTMHTLRSLAWVPFTAQNSNASFYKPIELRSKKHSLLVEHSMPLTDEFNEQASKYLKLNDSPPAEKVVENLTALSYRYKTEDSGTLVMKLHSIYKHVQDNQGPFWNVLSSMKIWNGGGFSDPFSIVLTYPEGLDLSCQIKKAPQDFLIYKRLFLDCGICETVPDEQVIGMLQKMMRDIEVRHSGCGTDVELKLSISILDWMKRKGHHSSDDLPIPVQTSKGMFALKPLSTTLFCDLPKERLNDLGDVLDYNIIHEDIPFATASFLKLPLLSTKILKPEYFEPWGPSEPITLRIKNILREYSEEIDLFKEMIQNADDAGATVCNFLVDMRQNLGFRNSLIDPAMTSCQGPALWSYNDSKFSEEDFRNITRVGAATKELQVEKIGKFGLGFNTVYRITDVPSILSGSSVLIFDPNATHLKKHIQSEANPGIKLNLQKHPHVLQLFSDQFQPYQKVFGCDLMDSVNYNGTLIRLPFRTEEDAKISKICNESFNEIQIKLFISNFTESSQNLIIFLRGVQKVTLGILSPDSSLPDQHKLHLEVSREQIQKINIADDFLLQSKQKTVTAALDENKVTCANGTTIIKVTLLQRSSPTYEKHFLLHSSFGIGESFQTYQANKKKTTRFDLPVAGVALPLLKNKDTGKWRPDLEDFEGRVFCFLPLPISSGLPFHLNGSFSIMSNRKSLWDTTEKGEWNRKLLCDAVLVTWARALAQLQQMARDGDLIEYSYHTFWPDIGRTKSGFVEALKAFYRAVSHGLADSLPAVFSNGKAWCTINHACFLSSDIVANKQVGETATKVFSAMLPHPFVAVTLPEWVKAGFHASDCGDALLPNTYCWERFYRDIVFSNLKSLAARERDVLITYAIDMKNKEVDKLLKSSACIPSTPSGVLQFIGKLVHPHGRVATLFEMKDGRFPQGTPDTYRNPERLSRLEHLGMLKDSIPMMQLIEQAQNISTLWETDRQKACKRIRCVLELLSDLVGHTHRKSDQMMFSSIAFLPASLPNHSNVQKLSEIAIKKPTEIFHYKQLSLVSLSQPVLSKEHVGRDFKFSSDILDFLGLNRIPSVQAVMLQIEEATRKTNILSQQVLTQTIRKCYTFLNKVIQNTPKKRSEIKTRALTFPFILIGQECVLLSAVARSVSFEAAPYLYQLPKEYQEFDKLWECVGLQENFAFEDYMAALQSIARKHHGKGLPKNDFDLALKLITGVFEKTDDIGVSDYQAQGILLPDQDCILHAADKLHFNDTQWLPCGKDMLFCHEMIPRSVALKFKVPTRIHKTLQNLKISKLSHWVSNFGSKEDLTRRIKNIINEYSSKKDILKELIQNADDSGATDLHFVWDSRTHPSLRIFGDEWKPLQGPALCIYNNKLFTDDDIDGIQQLGKGGKGDKLDKTGKYGLGFNAVYHLTDCPSFVTGDSMLCVFDPNLLFLKTSDHNSPGAMMTVNPEFKNIFQDVYDTFLHDMFDLEHGTLFRLPLRTAETVAQSQISKKTVSSKDIKELCEELERDASSLVLFLNNIKTVTFSQISEEDGQLEKIISIETKISNICATNQVAFQKKLHDFAEGELPIDVATPYQVFYTVEVKCSSSASPTKWILAKQIGVGGEEKLADVCRVYENLNYPRLPHGAVAACMNDVIPGRAFCTLPLPTETGLPVHINGSFIVDSARRDICKEDGGSIKTEWNSLLLTHVLAPLYCDLLEHLHKTMIQNTTGSLKFENIRASKYFLEPKLFNFFPHISEKIPHLWQKMVRQVYCTIFEKQSPLIPVYRKETVKIHTFTKDIVTVQWSAVCKKTVTEEPFFLLGELNVEVERALQNISMRLVLPIDSLQKIFEEFKKGGLEVSVLCPETVCIFLKAQRLHEEGRYLPLLVSDTVLQNEACCHCLLNLCFNVDRKKSDNCLDGLPLLVTLDGKLRMFCKTEPKYHTKFASLFLGHEHMFTSQKVVGDVHVQQLEEAGFLKEFTLQESAKYIKDSLGKSFQVPSTEAIVHHELANSRKDWLASVWNFFETKINEGSEKDKSPPLFQELVDIFFDWTIVPVTFENHNATFVMSLGYLNAIVHECLDEVAKCLCKLGFAKINTSLLPFDLYYNHIKPCLVQTNDCSSVLEVLRARASLLHWDKLKDWEIDTVLRFLVNGLPNIQNKRDFVNKLEYLPLFQTMGGRRQCLSIYQKKYILDTKLSKELEFFQELYQIDTYTIFLCDHYIYKKVAEDLNIQIIDDIQFLIHFVLPLLPSMSERQHLKVLKLLCDIRYHYLTEFEANKCIVFSSLSSVQFIRDVQGTLQQASYFYDHDNSIFQTFNLHARFIPKNFFKLLGFDNLYLQEMLYGLGMKHEVSNEDIIAFASEIEQDAKSGISVKSLKPKIKALFSHMLHLEVGKLPEGFVERVCTIRFLIPVNIESDLQNIYPSYTKNTSLIALKGSIVKSSDSDTMVWTSMAVLWTKFERSKKSLELLKKCGLLFSPPVASVLENLKNVCHVPCKCKKLLQIRSRVLQEMYFFLQEHLPFDSTPLMSSPVILVEEGDLAEPSQVVLSLHEDIVFRPYLFRLPPRLIRYSLLFQHIGVEEEPSIFHYARVLATIHEETKEKELPHGNQRKTLLKATEKLLLLLNEIKPGTDLQRLKPLYLPASDGRLYDSTTLLFNNCNSNRSISCLEPAFKFLVHLEDCSLFKDQYALGKLLKQLPEEIQPQMLSEVTAESLESKVTCKLGGICELKGQLQGLLLSRSFHDALVSLLRSQNSGELSTKEAAKQCRAVFSKLEIICCEKIQTVLVLLKDSNALPGTSLCKDVFIKKGENGQCHVYLMHKEAMELRQSVKIIASLAKEINVIMMNVLSSESSRILLEILTCKCPEEISEVLKEHGILSGNSASRAAFSMPHPGEVIPGEWHDSLDMSILNSFKVGDYVGYMDSSGEDMYLYAIILEQLESKVSGNMEVQMFRIDLGPERIIDVSALDLYQFKRCYISKNNCRELVVVEDPEEQKEKQDKWFEKSLGDIKNSIDEQLKNIWKLSKEERTKSIRRLYLRYHPDKNIGQEKLANEICIYLQQKIRDLEEGRNSCSQGNSKRQSNFSGGFSNFWSRWDGEASRHRRNREHFTRKSKSEYDFWGYHNRQQRKPRPDEACRWFQQAKCDLRAASNDVGRDSCEWVLYKVHQATEKALVAALCKNHGRFDTDFPISDLAAKVSTFSSDLEELPEKVSELERQGVDNKGTQYPHYHPVPGIPNNSFPLIQEDTVIQVAKDILDKISAFIQQR
ncbi:sacsin-like [Ambystoma mexicanum]|uniref:sacsin-like n=1 Tax=Ambystoma mexicanum TaxID=8296 RepID=UPI0037E87176